MTDTQIDKLIMDEKILFRSYNTNNAKYISLSNQIQLKVLYSNKDKRKGLSSDIKQCIGFHFKSLEENEIHYDQINLDLLFSHIDCVGSSDKVLLANYLIRTIRKNSYFDNEDFCIRKLNQYERESLKNSKGIFSLIKKFHLFCTGNLMNAIFMLIVSYFIFSFVLLHSFNSSFHYYEVNYVAIYKNYYINHFCNTLGYFFGLFQDFKILPKNWLALVFMVIAKIIFIVFIVNVLLNQIIKRINK